MKKYKCSFIILSIILCILVLSGSSCNGMRKNPVVEIDDFTGHKSILGTVSNKVLNKQPYLSEITVRYYLISTLTVEGSLSTFLYIQEANINGWSIPYQIIIDKDTCRIPTEIVNSDYMYVTGGYGIHRETIIPPIPDRYLKQNNSFKVKIYNQKAHDIIIEITPDMINAQLLEIKRFLVEE